ncbi:hypothetical protein AJ79_05615 [Helicocarpus griseus UAMH5409]|uniref:Large ribosomal subunit protein mL54 n=1 Tax=Helicocarpus griseus UAMH5409 TaxID=1447875 RepID=A0A2B7XL40_9EURO|nr:hypothetical protein AJ79_05615 [Helicocarpus griseus UAMH5409]
MICQRCRTSLLHRLPLLQQSSASLQASRCATFLPYRQNIRSYSTPAPDALAPAQSAPASSITLQGVSSPSGSALTPKGAAPIVRSGTPAGTPLKGLGYVKNKPEIVAQEDHEYPEWLWGLLDKSKSKSQADGGVDVSTLNKKQRIRHEKKMAARAAAAPRKIPLHEQAVNITSADAVSQSPESLEAASSSVETRTKITQSARAARRKSIKEANFLRGM